MSDMVTASVRLPAATWTLLREMAERDNRPTSRELDYIIRTYAEWLRTPQAWKALLAAQGKPVHDYSAAIVHAANELVD